MPVQAMHARLTVESSRHASWKLRWNKYSKPYQKRLAEGFTALRSFLRTAGIGGELLIKGKSKEVDETLEQFVHAQHAAGLKSSLRTAKHAVLMLQIMRPRLRRTLQNTWEALKSWEESQPSRFRAPLPLALLVAMVCCSRLRAANSTSERDREMWYVFSALLLVGFFGLLRPGELVNIAGKDVSLPNSLTLGSSFAVIRIARPKNSRQMGIQQFVELRHPDAINWLSWLKVTSSQDRPFWKSSANKFRSMFRQVCDTLQISQLHLSPASLRAGGATWHVDEGIEINRIRFLGRWAHLRSLEHYIQVARAQQISLSLPHIVASKLKAFVMKWSFLLLLPKFFQAQVPFENQVPSALCRICHECDVVAELRSWGRLSQAV